MGADLLANIVIGELENVHTGEAARSDQCANGGGKQAQVLRDKRQGTKFLIRAPEEVEARAVEPAPVRTRLARGNTKVVLETQEVIQTHAVIQLEGATQARHPPNVSILLHAIPVVRGVAPNLAGCREAIGRNAGDLVGHTVLSQGEHAGLRPCICRIIGDVHGDVADDLDAAAMSVLQHLLPFAIKAILGVCMIFSAGRECLIGEDTNSVALQYLGQLMTRSAGVELFDRHKGAIGVEPLLVFARKFQVRGALEAAGLLELRERLPQLARAFFQKRLVARECGRSGIGGPKTIGGVDGKYLPVSHAHLGEMVDEATRGGAQGAGLSLGVGEGRDMADNARTGLHVFLQALLLVRVDDRGSQGPKLDLGATVCRAN